MKVLLTDPVVLICIGVFIVGFVGLLWAVGKFRSMPSSSTPSGSTDDLFTPASDLRDLDFKAPVLSSSESAGSPAVGKDVADRLESMTQRLTEMQSVLMKQSSGAGGAPISGGEPAGGVGQGFSPETIDKLLKIIGNVIQQVDVLQKSLNVSK